MTIERTIKAETKDGRKFKASIKAEVEAPEGALLMGLEPIAGLDYVQRTYNNVPQPFSMLVEAYVGLPLHDNMLQAYSRYFSGLSVLSNAIATEYDPKQTTSAVYIAEANERLAEYHRQHMAAWLQGDPSLVGLTLEAGSPLSKISVPRVSYDHFLRQQVAIGACTKLGSVMNLISAYNVVAADTDIPKIETEVTLLPAKPL